MQQRWWMQQVGAYTNFCDARRIQRTKQPRKNQAACLWNAPQDQGRKEITMTITHQRWKRTSVTSIVCGSLPYIMPVKPVFPPFPYKQLTSASRRYIKEGKSTTAAYRSRQCKQHRNDIQTIQLLHAHPVYPNCLLPRRSLTMQKSGDSSSPHLDARI